jgi:hypothetical protein
VRKRVPTFSSRSAPPRTRKARKHWGSQSRITLACLLTAEPGLWSDGFRGVLAPSAARPARCVLCLFRETDDIAVATPLRPPITYRHVPVPPTGMTT